MAESSKRVVVVGGRSRRPWALQSKDRILEAATAEIAAVGFDRAKISGIAKRADMAPGSVYTWFENKEDLFRAALENALKDQVLNNQVALADVDTKLNWVFQLAALVPRNHDDKGPTTAQMLLIESYYAAWRDKKARKKLLPNINAHVDLHVNIIRTAQEEGHISKEIDADALGLLFLALPTGLSVLNLAGAPRVNDASWPAILTRVASALKK
jgi:AcrR family transcriptional regulator